MALYDYQQKTVDMLWDWYGEGVGVNPCIVLPTGAGKSYVVAEICRRALSEHPNTRVLMLTHVKELIKQNAEKMRIIWPGCPLGIVSAGLGKREFGEPIIFAGIGSVAKRVKELGYIDLIIVDECHMINHKDSGSYRSLFSSLKIINENICVVGLTATPYRLGHGLITDNPAIFDDLIEPITIEELVGRGFLAPLRSKLTSFSLDVSGVKKAGGEFIEAALQKAVNTKDQNAKAVNETISIAGDRRHWLFFCSGVEHSERIAELLIAAGINAACLTGKNTKTEREQKIADFKSGKIKALTNANILTTGFDFPDIDLIVFLRPTASTVLYVQMSGRGMRRKGHTDHCLVLDFAGNVARLGPITTLTPPNKAGPGTGEPPVKVCDGCAELVHISLMVCPCCGLTFPPPPPKPLVLHDDDIMGADLTKTIPVTMWSWRRHISRTSGMEMIAVDYMGDLIKKPITEYLTVKHDGYAGKKAIKTLLEIATKTGVDVDVDLDINHVVKIMETTNPPVELTYKVVGKFHQILTRTWANET